MKQIDESDSYLKAVAWANGPLSTENLDWRKFISDLRLLHNIVPLKSLAFKQRGGDPTLYDYTVIADDNREWMQVIRIISPSDISVSFAAPDYWNILGFQNQIKVRTDVQALVLVYDVYRIDVDFM